MTPKEEPVMPGRAPKTESAAPPKEITWLYRANPRKLAELTRPPDEVKHVRNASGE